MAVPPNITPETAEAITTLPYTQTLDVSDAPTNTDFLPTCDSDGRNVVWYTYTTTSTEAQLSLSVDVSVPFAVYTPTVSVWVGTPPALTQYVVGTQEYCDALGGSVFSLAVDPSTTYYFQVANGSATTPLGASLVFSLDGPPCETTSAGSLIINDDEDGFPAMLLSAVDGTPVRAVGAYPAGEFGDSVASGVYCVQDGEADTGIALLDLNLQVTDTVDFSPATVHGIKSNRVDTFYIVTQVGSDPYVVTEMALDGTLGTTHTLPSNSSNAGCFAVTRDGATFYYARKSNSGAAVHAFDLGTDTPLADLDAGTMGRSLEGIGDGYVASDGTILFMYADWGTGGDNGTIVRFNDDGSVHTTYTITGSISFVNHFAFADDTPGSFWVWGSPVFGQNPAAFQRIKLSDSSVLGDLTGIEVNFTSGGPSDDPNPISNSCPLLILQADMTAECATCDAIAITVQPLSQTVDQGDIVTLTVTVTGTEPIGYQWYLGESGDQSTPVGTNSASYETDPLESDVSYWVQVSNVCGSGSSAFSDTAVITVTPAPPTPGEPQTTFPIRCVRRSPTVSSDGKRIRHVRFELDCMVGQGNADSPNPIMTLRTSDDNGSTWSSNREASLGPVGAYLQKVKWYQLGSAYNRTYEIVFSDAVDICIVQAWLDLEGLDH